MQLKDAAYLLLYAGDIAPNKKTWNYRLISTAVYCYAPKNLRFTEVGSNIL